MNMLLQHGFGEALDRFGSAQLDALLDRADAGNELALSELTPWEFTTEEDDPE